MAFHVINRNAPQKIRQLLLRIMAQKLREREGGKFQEDRV